MSFWKKIFNKKNIVLKESLFETYKKELNDKDLKTLFNLEQIVSPLIKKTTKLDVQKPSKLYKKSQLASHFGGHPYFEKGEEWPTSKSGKHLDFIFQVFNSPELELPNNIKLIQFFYCREEFPWDTENDGWLVKIYDKTNHHNIKLIKKPEETEKPKFCTIKFKSTETLPHWEDIESIYNEAFELSSMIDDDEPWEAYEQIVSKLIGEQNFQSQLGGYPKWIQGEATPTDIEGNPLRLLFQIDSEGNAGLMWGDSGLIYVFYDETNGDIEFCLQCY